MSLIEASIRRPVAVVVGVALLLLMGLIALARMPYQLSPTVIEPEISISTRWPGASPLELEREVLEAQEEVLKGIPGLVEMEGTASDGTGSITLRFRVGTDVDAALLRVSNKLQEVASYPQGVERPVITATGAATSPVVWMILKSLPGNPRSVYTYRTFFENEVRQYLERVPGVADLFVAGGTEEELQVLVKPQRLASHGLTLAQVARALAEENINISAGLMDVGRRSFRVRTVGQFSKPEELRSLVLYSDGQRRVLLGDVARVRLGYERPTVAMMHNGQEGIAVGAKPEPGANVLELTDRLHRAVKRLNAEVLRPKGIYLEWVYDQRPYIKGAINLLKRNILIGGALAAVVLLLFLQSAVATLVVAVAIPISIIGAFIFMALTGRTLNAVSLAGIAFAVGMLLDAAIVVLENIKRHLEAGKSPFQASLEGTREVWGAVLASTLTTVAVFLPVVLVREEAGQLFKDIAIAVSFAMLLSLLVAVSVIPMVSEQLFRLRSPEHRRPLQPLRAWGHRVAEAVMRLVKAVTRAWPQQLATVVSLTLAAVLMSWALLPKMEYLPQGNRNLVISLLVPPPGLSYKERVEIGEHIFDFTKPYFRRDHQGVPGIKNLFYVGSQGVMLFGATSVHEDRAAQMVPLFQRLIRSIPGMFGVSSQAGIFQTRLGRGRSIDVDLRGRRLQDLTRAGRVLFGAIREAIPGAQIRPIPSLELLYPEVRFLPLRDRLRAVGMSTEELGIALDVLMDGRKVAEFSPPGGRQMDLVLRASEGEFHSPEELSGALLSTPSGRVVPVSSLSRLQHATGITQIRHLERARTITLQVRPPEEMPLQEAMELLRQKVLPGLKEAGMLKDVEVRLSGAADKLTQTRKALQFNLVLAALIAYLLMAALFENFLYPLVVMFTVPLAGAGGFLGLRAVDALIAPQRLDVLTMLGFVILVGVVVNNAILIVHQSLRNVRLHGMQAREAVLQATRVRLRPIYMSAATSIFGMLPLVLAPGPGSELYRGLGSVVLGGLALSTVFTVLVIPALLMLLMRVKGA